MEELPDFDAAPLPDFIKDRLELVTNGNEEVYEHIVNAPFDDKLFATNLDLGIVVLLLVNEADQMIDRVALSRTELAEGAVRASAKPFKAIRIPVDAETNAIAIVIKTGKPLCVYDWQYLFAPALTAEQARQNQQGASIECSVVWPLRSGSGGAMIFSFYQPPERISAEHLGFVKGYAERVDALLQAARRK